MAIAGTPLRFQGQNANTLLNLGGFTLDTAGTGAVDYNNAVNLSMEVPLQIILADDFGYGLILEFELDIDAGVL